MVTTNLLFGIFAFLAAFNAGTMTTLQIQHYGIYRFVGRTSFAEYMKANNEAALVPAILPALLLLFVSLLLLVARPAFMSLEEASVAFALNLAQLASTMIWQRKLQAEMAETGYDDAKIQRLLTTNWIRTVAFLLEALMATAILLSAFGQIR
jgi:hypothetical protein